MMAARHGRRDDDVHNGFLLETAVDGLFGSRLGRRPAARTVVLASAQRGAGPALMARPALDALADKPRGDWPVPIRLWPRVGGQNQSFKLFLSE